MEFEDEEYPLKPYKRYDKDPTSSERLAMEHEEAELPYTIFKRYDNGMYAMRFTLPGQS